MCLEVREDAVIVADSHTHKGDDALIHALNEVCANRAPSQIILLGDISNLFVGAIPSSVDSNHALIKILESLANHAQIIYFEGNHDFALREALPFAMIVPRAKQPLLCRYAGCEILLSHGDILLNKQYEIYIRTLTARGILAMLRALDTLSRGKIYDFIDKKVQRKDIKLPQNADEITQWRIEAYKNYLKSRNLRVKAVIEGHFHINKCVKIDDFTYIALPSFYHNRRILRFGELGI